MFSPSILDVLRDRVLVLDGAMGTSIHALDLPLRDYDGLENCNEVLVLTRPDAIADIHRSFLAVGCDAGRVERRPTMDRMRDGRPNHVIVWWAGTRPGGAPVRRVATVPDGLVPPYVVGFTLRPASLTDGR